MFQRDMLHNCLLPATHWFLAWLISWPSKMLADLHRTTWRYIPHNISLHNHCCENLKSYMVTTFLPINHFHIHFKLWLSCGTTFSNIWDINADVKQYYNTWQRARKWQATSWMTWEQVPAVTVYYMWWHLQDDVIHSVT
jgi:hypothetical protein